MEVNKVTSSHKPPHNNEELRNTNGCYLVTQFSSNPNNRLILR